LCFVLGDDKNSPSYNESKGKEILSFEQILFCVIVYNFFFLTEGGYNGSQPTDGNGM
jgi:hypothetical protein